MKLLTIVNPKTAKGAARGYLTAVLHLAPFKASGLNVCPMAELAGCAAGCLNTAGRGGISAGSRKFNPHGIELPDNQIQRARIARTHFFANDRGAFMAQLCAEIRRHVKRAARLGLKPAARLNGTSDIRWESIPTADEPNVFFAFPLVQFYDYTKVTNRRIEGIANYHLSISYSEASSRYASIAVNAARTQGRNLVVVTRTGGYTDDDRAAPQSLFDLAERAGARHIVDGDLHDLRFLDPPGSLVVLRAKGAARRDNSGFVLPV